MTGKSTGIWLMLIMIIGSCDLNNPSEGKQVFVTDGMFNSIVDGYWLYLPKGYSPDKKWPVILFLQGGEAASPDPNTSKLAGPAKYALNKQQTVISKSFIIINPHMRTGPAEKRQWSQYPHSLSKIVDDVVGKYEGDKKRIYLTGLSRGGSGAWALAKFYPEKFAAIAPISGSLSCRSDCDKLAKLPLWIAHNTNDDVVDYDRSLKAVEYIEDNSNKEFLKFKAANYNRSEVISADKVFFSLSEEGHDAWTKTYSNLDFYHWFMDKKLD